MYRYIAHKDDGNLVRGKLSAESEDAAVNLLNYAGYRVVSLKKIIPLHKLASLTIGNPKTKPNEIILFYRQLALLLESGIGIVEALEILQQQISDNSLRKIIGEIIGELRNGTPLSVAMDKYPKVFSALARRSLRVGERAGGIETILRQIADYMQKEVNTAKGTKSALTYPTIALVATFVVIAVLVGFVLPTFGELYGSMGSDLPAITRGLLDFSASVRANGLQIIMFVFLLISGVLLYVRTPKGRLQFDRFLLTMPIIGRINQLKELSQCCRNIALLFHAGLPLTEIMVLLVESSSNKAMTDAISQVKQDMLKGEGLSKPMSKNKLFLPTMVQMVKVGEESGRLDSTLLAVADSYEIEAKDKTDAMISLIQPTMTVVIGGIIGLLALSMVSAMYSVYGQAF